MADKVKPRIMREVKQQIKPKKIGVKRPVRPATVNGRKAL